MNGPPEKANGPCQGAAASKDRIINRPISINPSQGCGKENLGGHLIDRFGHIHSESIFTSWSPQAIQAMGIHRKGGA
jgi:hypothetical protein